MNLINKFVRHIILLLNYFILKISIINETCSYPIWHILSNCICTYYEITERIESERMEI